MMLIGYARCSTDDQDLTAQRDALETLGVNIKRIYVDHGLTGTNRDRPGLREALAACRAGDTLVVTKLDRLARSLPDARDIVTNSPHARVKLNLGGSIHDPTDPVGQLLFNVLAMVAEFESDLIRMRTREGMKIAKARGRLRRKQQPKLSATQEKERSIAGHRRPWGRALHSAVDAEWLRTCPGIPGSALRWGPHRCGRSLPHWERQYEPRSTPPAG